jgi:hypothetical protein
MLHSSRLGSTYNTLVGHKVQERWPGENSDTATHEYPSGHFRHPEIPELLVVKYYRVVSERSRTNGSRGSKFYCRKNNDRNN